MISTWSTVCATSASTWLETSTVRPSGGERAQEVAQPAHALRVEPVRRLVEDEQLGLAEQRRREAEPLAHAERVALDAASCRVLELDERSTSSTRESGTPDGAAEHPQVVAPGATRVEVGRLEHRADPQRRLARARA